MLAYLKCTTFKYRSRTIEYYHRTDPHIEQLAKTAKKSEEMCVWRARPIRLPHGFDELQTVQTSKTNSLQNNRYQFDMYVNIHLFYE